jgi:hypothetical protein
MQIIFQLSSVRKKVVIEEIDEEDDDEEIRNHGKKF